MIKLNKTTPETSMGTYYAKFNMFRHSGGSPVCMYKQKTLDKKKKMYCVRVFIYLFKYWINSLMLNSKEFLIVYSKAKINFQYYFILFVYLFWLKCEYIFTDKRHTTYKPQVSIFSASTELVIR